MIRGGGQKLSFVQYNTDASEYPDGFIMTAAGRSAAAAAGQVSHVPTQAKLLSITLQCQSAHGPMRVFVNSNLIANRAAQQFRGGQRHYYVPSPT